MARGIGAIAILVAACGPEAELSAPDPVVRPNVLLIVLDDVGVDKVAAYGDPDAPPTPHLDALAADGVRFERAYADPMCSPTRAGILTGRHGFRYGIGTFLPLFPRYSLPDGEVTLAEALVGYESAAAGKFHLGGDLDMRPHPAFALDQGFDRYDGKPNNLHGAVTLTDVEDYFHYDSLDEDGRWRVSEGYLTTDETDTALRWLPTLREPWFLQVGYHAAHAPWHAPPDSLDPTGADDDDPIGVLHDAMVASVDQEIGRLLAGLAPEVRERTVIIVVGDNGTPSEAATAERVGLPGKATLYEGGVHVPLIVAGGVVRGRGVSDALISHVDLYATVLDLVGSTAPRGGDATSFAALLDDPGAPGTRDHVYAEYFGPNGPGPYDFRVRMVRGERHKLIRATDGSEMLFDLEADPLERTNLLAGPLDPASDAALATLRAHLAAYEAAAAR